MKFSEMASASEKDRASGIKDPFSEQASKFKEFNLISQLKTIFEEATSYEKAIMQSLEGGPGAPASGSSSAVKQHPQGQKTEPVIEPDDLRRELFKFYYATSDPEKFDLYKKADASEFLRCLLELLHFCLNKNSLKKDVDDRCGLPVEGSTSEIQENSMCTIHNKMHMRIIEKKSCKCNP